MVLAVVMKCILLKEIFFDEIIALNTNKTYIRIDITIVLLVKVDEKKIYKCRIFRLCVPPFS